MKRILVPALATVFTVVMLIGVHGWNRSGEPRQRITLTERELPLSWRGPADRGDLHFRIESQGRFDPLDARNWLTEERLRALGFVFDVMPGAPEAAHAYSRALPKTAWVAFEYEGLAWRDIERRRALMEPQRDPGSFYPAARLVPIDASLDRDALIARYPTAHLVLRASIQLAYRGPEEKGPVVYGYIRHLIPDHLSVADFAKDRLANLPEREQPFRPRYEVDVAVGRLGIPYVVDVLRE